MAEDEGRDAIDIYIYFVQSTLTALSLAQIHLYLITIYNKGKVPWSPQRLLFIISEALEERALFASDSRHSLGASF